MNTSINVIVALWNENYQRQPSRLNRFNSGEHTRLGYKMGCVFLVNLAELFSGIHRTSSISRNRLISKWRSVVFLIISLYNVRLHEVEGEDYSKSPLREAVSDNLASLPSYELKLLKTLKKFYLMRFKSRDRFSDSDIETNGDREMHVAYRYNHSRLEPEFHSAGPWMQDDKMTYSLIRSRG